MEIQLHENDIDLIRDSALLLENSHLPEALKLMSLAKRLRPGGKFIAAKCEELSEKKASNGCYTTVQSSLDFRNQYLLSDIANSSARKFIISADIHDMYAGLGCMLFILGPAWKYAKATGRTLVIDWRNNPYTRSDPSINLFSRLFDPSGLALSGVDVIADDQVNTMLFPSSILMSKIEKEHESGIVISSKKRGLNTDDVIDLVLNGIDSNAGTFIPSNEPMFRLANIYRPTKTSRASFYTHKEATLLYRLAKRYCPTKIERPSFCTHEEATLLYRSLKPRPHIQHQIDSYSKEHLADGPTIGIHVRHGNGEESVRTHFSSRVISEFDEFIDTIVTKIDKIAQQQQFTDFKVFLCTDSDQVTLALRERIPDLLTRNIWRPEHNQGVDFDHPFDSPEDGIQSAANALIDMQLLGKCDVAILTRPSTFACQVPYLQEKPNAIFLPSEDFNQL